MNEMEAIDRNEDEMRAGGTPLKVKQKLAPSGPNSSLPLPPFFRLGLRLLSLIVIITPSIELQGFLMMH